MGAIKRSRAKRVLYQDRHTQTQPGEQRLCGAFARSTGAPCQRRALANKRCANHGGLSTGPTTQSGKVRALANLKQYRDLADSDLPDTPEEIDKRIAELDKEIANLQAQL